MVIYIGEQMMNFDKRVWESFTSGRFANSRVIILSVLCFLRGLW
jgi:hypothetical protein